MRLFYRHRHRRYYNCHSPPPHNGQKRKKMCTMQRSVIKIVFKKLNYSKSGKNSANTCKKFFKPVCSLCYATTRQVYGLQPVSKPMCSTGSLTNRVMKWTEWLLYWKLYLLCKCNVQDWIGSDHSILNALVYI